MCEMLKYVLGAIVVGIAVGTALLATKFRPIPVARPRFQHTNARALLTSDSDGVFEALELAAISADEICTEPKNPKRVINNVQG